MNITKTAKRFVQLLLLILVLLIGAAFAIPYFFKDQLVQRIQEDINKNLQATVAFEDVSLSLFRSFPNFSFSLDEFSIKGKNEFENLTLTSAKNLRFTLDLMSVIKEDRPIEIQEVHLEDPEINILILASGKANYDITLPSDAAAATAEDDGAYSFLIQLEEYGIESGDFTYEDRQANIFVKLLDIDHQGKGDFTQDVFDLVTQTDIEKMTIRQGGINYLYKSRGDFDITFNANLPTNTYTIKNNDLRINDLRLKADGRVISEDFVVYDVDLDFSAPENNFKNFLSLIPNAYTKDYDAVKASGKLQLSGQVRGVYDGDKERYPAFKLSLDIDQGSFQYPDLPMGIDNILAKVLINSPSSDFDQMTIDIPHINFQLGASPFEAQFKLRTPVSDPDIDAVMKGKIDLAELAKAFPIEGLESLSGIIDADLVAKAKMSDMDRGDYEAVNMQGKLGISQLNYVSSDMPTVKIKSMDLDFTPRQINVPAFEMRLGKSDLKGSGSIKNILAYFSPEKTMKGQFDIRSNLFDANEWLEEEESAASGNTSVAADDSSSEIFDRFDFDIKAQVGKIRYDIYEIDRSTFQGNITPSKLSIDKFALLLGKSDLSGSGSLSNIFNYIFSDGTLGGKLALQSKFFDLNPFMEESPAGANAQAKQIAAEDLEPFLVPERMDIAIDAKVGKVLYTDLEINNVDGLIEVKEEAIQFKNCKARMLDGNMLISGAYNTTDAEKPAFDLNYKLQAFDFQKTFKQFNTFALLAPIGKYMEGRFNSALSFSGTLDKELMPILDKVNADGFFQTINSVVRGLEPLEQIGQKLNIDLFKKFEIKDTKNWFIVENGLVTLKDFKLKQQGIDMLIGGSHSFDQAMDYHINAKIPRALMEKGAIGNISNKGIGFLKKEAGKYGVNIDVGEFINVLIKLTGSIQNPKVSFKVLGADGEKTIVEAIKEEAKAVVEEKVEEVKEEVTKVVEEKKEDVRKKMDAEINTIMAAAEKQAAAIRKAGRKTAVEAKKAGYKQADDLVKAAGKNPIKKQAAKLAAKKIKKETDKKEKDIIKKADQKADQAMATARKKVESVKKKYGEL